MKKHSARIPRGLVTGSFNNVFGMTLMNIRKKYFPHRFPGKTRLVTKTLFLLLFLIGTGCVSTSEKRENLSTKVPESVSKEKKTFMSAVHVEVMDTVTLVRIVANESFKYTSYMFNRHQGLTILAEDIQAETAVREIPANNGLIQNIKIENLADERMTRVEILLNHPSECDLRMEGSVLIASFISKKKEEIRKTPPPGAEVNKLKQEIKRLEGRISMMEEWIDKNISYSPAETKKEVDPQPHASTEEGSRSEADPAIIDAIEGWRQAWQNKNMKTYGDFYADTFSQDGKEKEAWLFLKKDKFSRSKKIGVKIENLRVSRDGNLALVEFIQHYHSGSYKDKGSKAIVMLKTNDGWKIQSENWEALQ